MSALVTVPKARLLEANAALLPLLQEIIRHCERRNIRYDRPLVNFVMNLLSLDPKFELFMETLSADRRNHDDFVEACCGLLADDRSPALIALRMQVYFLDNFFDKDEIVEKHARNLQAKTFPLTKEIVDNDVITKDEQDDIFDKVILDIVMTMGLGNPECKDVLAETMRALNSVMSRSDKAKFVTLDRKDRLMALKDIREIVAGIRIFNKHSGNTANGMADLPKILDQSHESTKSILQITLCEIMDKVNLLTSALNAAIAYDLRNQSIITLLPENITSDDFETIKDLLIMYRQHEVYTRKLIDELAAIKLAIDSCKLEYEAKLLRIHEAVQYRTAIPTDRVFPKFSELTRVWLQFQNFIFLLSEMNQMSNMLTSLTERCASFDDLAYRLLGESQIQTDVDRLNKVKAKRLALTEPKNCEIVPFEDNMEIQLLKFCLWHVAEGKGLLMPGSVDMGVCRMQKENYLFNIAEPAVFFDEDPNKYFYKIVETARKKIQLVCLLNVYDKVHSSYNAPRSEGFQMKITTTCDQEVQTELHPVPANIDREYRWNVWDYRREAIRLANLRTKRTSAVQTLESSRALPKSTQIYRGRSQGTQTRVSRSTETDGHQNQRQPIGLKVIEPSGPSPLKVYALTLAQASHSAPFGRNGERSN